MADSPLSDKDAIALLMSQVISRNKEISLRQQTMTKAINMLKSGDWTKNEVITVLLDEM